MDDAEKLLVTSQELTKGDTFVAERMRRDNVPPSAAMGRNHEIGSSIRNVSHISTPIALPSSLSATLPYMQSFDKMSLMEKHGLDVDALYQKYYKRKGENHAASNNMTTNEPYPAGPAGLALVDDFSSSSAEKNYGNIAKAPTFTRREKTRQDDFEGGTHSNAAEENKEESSSYRNTNSQVLDELHICERCSGTGLMRVSYNFQSRDYNCDDCNGDGLIQRSKVK